MKPGIKIIKRKQNDDSTTLATANTELSAERSTREMVSTVKGWIAELQQRKRTEAHSFSRLPVVVTVRESDYMETPA